MTTLVDFTDATATIPGFNNGGGIYYTATFGTPATLTSGTQYALILRPVALPSAGGYFWIRASPSSYAPSTSPGYACRCAS